MRTVIFSTTDPQALAWCQGYLQRREVALQRIDEFAAAVTPLIGPCQHGNARHDVVYQDLGDELVVIGVRADPKDADELPRGFSVAHGVIVGDPSQSVGLKYSDLAEQHSTLRLFGDIDVIGIPHALRIGKEGKETPPAIGMDFARGIAYQRWPAAKGVRRAVRHAAERSGVPWTQVTGEELETVETRKEE